MKSRISGTGLQRNLLAQSLALVLGMQFAGGLMAQEAAKADATEETKEESKELEAVQVIGSRIKRSEVEGPSPVTVIRSEQLVKEGFSSIADVIESLSQNTGAAQNDLNSAGGFTPNAAVINLRGLGPGRTLLLINGRRANDYPFPYNGRSNFQNFNNIPIAAVDRIEVLAGGASAIYGSDAVAGVVNVVMKESYEGNSVKLKAQSSTQGGRSLFDLQWVGGGSTDDWSWIYAVESFNVNPVYAFQREFMDSAQDNPAPPGVNGSAGVGGYQPPIGIQIRRVGGATLNSYLQPAGRGCSNVPGFRPHTYTSSVSGTTLGPGCGYDASPAQQSISNGNNALSAYVFGTFTINENLSAWASLSGFNSKSDLSGGVEQWFGGPQPNATFYDPQFGVRILPIRTLTPESYGGISGTDQKFKEKSFDLAFGLKGTIADRFDWDLTLSTAKYNAIRDRPRLTVAGATAYFMGPQLGVTTGATAPGVPAGVPIYQLNLDRFYGPISPADYASMSTMVHYDGESKNAAMSFVVTGDLFDMPAGPVGFAAVVEATQQSYDLETDARIFPSVRTVYNLTGTGGGGERSRYALGTEFKVPLFDMLTLSLAGRLDKYDDITDVDDAKTWGAGLEFRPFDNLLIRGNYSTSFKAPDMHYVFSERSGAFQGIVDYNRCTANGIATNVCASAGGTYNYSAFITSQGQPGLKEETGKSFTAGFVWDITSSLALSLDYYRVDLKDVVIVQSGADILTASSGCLTGLYPTTGAPFPYAAGSEYCNNINARIDRDSLGAISEIRSGPINQSFLGTKGIDGSLTYRWDTDRYGSFSSSLSWSHVLEQTDRATPTDPLRSYRDDNANADFRSRTRLNLGWSKNDWDATILVTQLGSFPVWQPAAATARGLDSRIGTFTTWNLNVGKKVTENLSVRGYVNNVSDKTFPTDTTFNAYPYFWRAYSPIGREIGADITIKW